MNHTKANQKQILNSNGETGKNSKLFFILIKSDIQKKYFRSQKKIFRKILIVLRVLFVSNEPKAFLNVFRIGLDLFLNRKVRADSKRHQIGTNSQYDITLPFIPK